MLVAHLVWWQSGILFYFTHCPICNPVPLCQNKLGMERNTTPTGLLWIYIYIYIIIWKYTKQLLIQEPI